MTGMNFSIEHGALQPAQALDKDIYLSQAPEKFHPNDGTRTQASTYIVLGSFPKRSI